MADPATAPELSNPIGVSLAKDQSFAASEPSNENAVAEVRTFPGNYAQHPSHYAIMNIMTDSELYTR